MKDQIILYNGPNSPFGRKTKITAIVQEVEVEEKIIDFDKEKMNEKIRHKLIEKRGMKNIKVRFFD